MLLLQANFNDIISLVKVHCVNFKLTKDIRVISMSIAEQNLISDDNAEKLIAAHDGDIALLYIWLSRRGKFDADRAARELCRTAGEIAKAHEKLMRMQLGQAPAAAAEPKLPPAEELPEYTSDDIVRRSKEDPGFQAVIMQARSKLGRTLSTADMKTLFGIYDYLALPADVIFMLIGYCIDVFAEKYGPGRLPSMRSIEKEAYSWANKEIITIEQADEYIRAAAEKRSRAGELKTAMGLGSRVLTPTERKYMTAWFDMGFDNEAILIAYDRTVTNTGALKWGYMNKILLSWQEKGIRTAADVQERDSRSPAAMVKAENQHRSSVSGDELKRLRSIYEKVKNG